MTLELSSRRILVTGGAGFLGQAVCRVLRSRGCEQLLIPRRKDFDLIDPAAVEKLLDDTRPEIIIHLAAEVGGIGANRAQPGRFFYANMAMGLNLVEAARIRGIEKFIQLGTVCAYPKFTPVPFSEADLWSGYPEETNAPYGIAKKALLVMLQSYRQQYAFPGIFLLPVNLYGPGDNFNPTSSHVIPALIRKCLLARNRGDAEIIAWGTGRASREFLYVDDCADGIVRACEQYDDAEPVNLGSGREISIFDLTNLIAELTGYPGRIVWDPSQPDGQPRRCLDTSRAREGFGFEAKTSFRDGLIRTIEWAEAQGVARE